MRALLLAGSMVGLPAFAQPAPANAQQAEALPALPTAADFLAAVHAHPDAIITRAAYLDARNAFIVAVQAHGEASPQAIQANDTLTVRATEWINAVMTSYGQLRTQLLNQGHSMLAIHNAFGHLNLFDGN